MVYRSLSLHKSPEPLDPGEDQGDAKDDGVETAGAKNDVVVDVICKEINFQFLYMSPAHHV